MRNYTEERQQMPMDKAAFRSHCLKKFKSAPAATKRYRDAKIRSNLAAVLREHRPKTVLFYWPLPFEADLRLLAKEMRRNCDVYLPFMEGVSFKMVPFRLPLKQNAMGIFEAGHTNRTIKKVDIVIVPAVGVDADARRIGFGKGMYDRFYAGLKTKPIMVFIQPIHCFTTERICDHYDVSADLLVTPQCCYSKNRKRTYATSSNVRRSNPLRRGYCHHQRARRFFRR